MWDIDVDQDNANRLAIGTQDNGTILYDIDINNSSNGWAKVMDGDGFVTLIDYSSEKYLFHTDAQVPGSIRRSNDLGITWTGNLRPTGASTDDSRFPLIQHSTMPNIMYTGFQNIFKSYDYGLSWTQITNINASQKVKKILQFVNRNRNIYILIMDIQFGARLRSKDGSGIHRMEELLGWIGHRP